MVSIYNIIVFLSYQYLNSCLKKDEYFLFLNSFLF